MKIITNSNDFDYRGEDILLDEVVITYSQNPDCTEDQEGNQQVMKISTRDGGGGNFLHIETEGWSISGINDLKLIIEDFNKRIS